MRRALGDGKLLTGAIRTGVREFLPNRLQGIPAECRPGDERTRMRDSHQHDLAGFLPPLDYAGLARAGT